MRSHATHSDQQRRRHLRPRSARAGRGRQGSRHRKHRRAKPGAQRRGAIADDPATHLLRARSRTRMVRRRDSDRRHDRGIAQALPSATAARPGDLRHQWRRQHGRKCFLFGTVGAAMEAAINQVPALAISVAHHGPDIVYEPAAQFTRRLAEIALSEGLPAGMLLNVNVPLHWKGGVRFTRQSKKVTRNVLKEGTDPRGRTYYWLSEQQMVGRAGPRERLRRRFRRRRFHHSARTGPHARSFAQSPLALGQVARAHRAVVTRATPPRISAAKIQDQDSVRRRCRIQELAAAGIFARFRQIWTILIAVGQVELHWTQSLRWLPRTAGPPVHLKFTSAMDRTADERRPMMKRLSVVLLLACFALPLALASGAGMPGVRRQRDDRATARSIATAIVARLESW